MKFGVWMPLCAVLILLFAAGCTLYGANPPQTSPTLGNTTVYAPVPVTQVKAWIEPLCSGKTGAALANCTYNQAFNTRDVAVCTALGTMESRNTCIATWCGSAVRDYNSCYRIADYDDRLLCLSKCNPGRVN